MEFSMPTNVFISSHSRVWRQWVLAIVADAESHVLADRRRTRTLICTAIHSEELVRSQLHPTKARSLGKWIASLGLTASDSSYY